VYRIYYNRGTELIKVDEYDAAISDLKRSIALKSDWPFSYNNLGSAYLKNMEWRASIDAFTKAIDIAREKNGHESPSLFWKSDGLRVDG